MAVDEVSVRNVARKRGAVHEKDLVSLPPQEHRGRRTRAACPDDNHVVHGFHLVVESGPSTPVAGAGTTVPGRRDPDSLALTGESR